MQRYTGLDAIRATAMLLGLAYHATTAWLPDVARWYFVADASPVDALVFVSGALHAFRMQLFFALSGFFGHLVFERRGAQGFLTDRSRRLLVPLVIATPFVLVADLFTRTLSHQLGLMSPDYEPGATLRVAPLHLWFLLYLWSFCAVAYLLRAPQLTRALKFGLRWPAALLLLLSVPTGLGLFFHPENKPDLFFWPRPFEALHYGLFFAVGWGLWSLRDETQTLSKWAPFFLVTGVLGLVVVYRGPLQWTPTGHVLGAPIAWSLTLGALGLALKTREREASPALRFVVESSYWVYLVHYPMVLALQLFFAQLAWPGVLEYALTVVLTLGLAWLTFVFFVRDTALGPWLGVKPQRQAVTR